MTKHVLLLLAAAMITAALIYSAETGRYQLVVDSGLPVLVDTRTGEVFDCVRDGVIMDSDNPNAAALPVVTVDRNLGRYSRDLLLNCGNPKVISENRRKERGR